jgi:ATP-binding cassette subfamily B protein
MTSRRASPASPALSIPRDQATRTDPLRFVAHVARGRYRWWIAAMVVGEGINALCGILLPYALGSVTATVTKAPEGSHAIGPSLRHSLLLFAGLCLAELVLGRTNSALQLRVAPRQRQYVAKALFAYVHGHSHRFLNENFAGALAHRISETALGVNLVMWSIVQEFWPMAIVIGAANVLLAVGASPVLGLFMALWSAGFVGISAALARRTQPRAFAASSARSHTAGMVVDSVANHATVRLFAASRHERERIERAYESELETVLRANVELERIRVFQFVAATLLKVGTIALAIHLWHEGALGVGQFVMAVSLSLLIISEVRNLARRFLELFDALGNVGSGLRQLLQPHGLPDGEGAEELPIQRGAIEFDRVNFGYPGGTPLFREMSITIPPGQRVGLVGTSGSGKSTFVSLLLRLYDPDSGAIRIDGCDIRAFRQDSLHRQIGLIPQDPTLFHRTLRENIRYGRPDATDEEVESAARRAHADEFVARMPEGYDSMVGERGVKLSGGQRQRIAIARVVLKDAPVLVLDEATASLDSITEQHIQDALDEVMVGRTVLVIAHRLSTVASLDRILVFSDGLIVEDGQHDELLARRGGYFRLWQQQANGGEAPSPTIDPEPTRRVAE